MTFDELERRVHHELRRLPAPLAPDTLLPRVLAAVGKVEKVERVHIGVLEGP